MKACIACSHFHFDNGSPGYSTMTPGDDASMHCTRGHFVRGTADVDHGLLTHEAMLSKGATCPDFNLSELAASKGWTP